MNFGEALEAVKQDRWIRRAGWNGKNMHVYKEDARAEVIKGGTFAGETRRHDAYLCMFTAQGSHQAGWLASQADMLAEDWELVPLKDME